MHCLRLNTCPDRSFFLGGGNTSPIAGAWHGRLSDALCGGEFVYIDSAGAAYDHRREIDTCVQMEYVDCRFRLQSGAGI